MTNYRRVSLRSQTETLYVELDSFFPTTIATLITSIATLISTITTLVTTIVAALVTTIATDLITTIATNLISTIATLTTTLTTTITASLVARLSFVITTSLIMPTCAMKLETLSPYVAVCFVFLTFSVYGDQY